MTSEPQVENTETFFDKNKSLIFGSIGVILLAVIGFNGFRYSQKQKLNKVNEAVFQFRIDHYEKLVAKETSPEEVLSALNTLDNEVFNHESGAILVMNISAHLQKVGKTKEALEILNKLPKAHFKTPILGHLLSISQAGLHEDMGETLKAVTLLEEALGGGGKIGIAKLYFDLGRLHLKLGNLEQARSNLEYVLENFKEDDMARLASVYLAKMGTK